MAAWVNFANVMLGFWTTITMIYPIALPVIYSLYPAVHMSRTFDCEDYMEMLI